MGWATLLQRLYFAFRIRLKPFRRAGKIVWRPSESGENCVAPFGEREKLCGALRRARKIMWRPSEGRWRICSRIFAMEFLMIFLGRSSEGFQPNSKGKIEALKHVRRSYLRAHTSVRAKIHPRSSNFSRSFFRYQI